MNTPLQEFDPYCLDHVNAYKQLCETGIWPETIEIKERSESPIWVIVLQSKMADAWVHEAKKLLKQEREKKETNDLSKIAADTAMRSFIVYANQRGIAVNDYDEAVRILREHVKRALPEALDDAKTALDANMGKMAEATFVASMRLAGIEAAKEFEYLRD